MASKEGVPPSLHEVFTPLISYALFFAHSPSSQRRPFAVVRGEVERLLEEQKVLVKRYDLSQADYENARFAVVAWLDELVQRSTDATNPELHQQWSRSLLQVKLYNTANAGKDFFDEHLKQLSPTQKDIREIYHLCLCLGFRGRYYDEAQEYELIELRREHVQHLPIPFLDLFEIERKRERVTPQPYEVQPPPPKRQPRPPSPLWAALPLLVVVAVLLYYFWPRTSPEPPRKDLEEALRRFTCCQLEVAGIEKGIVSLTGRVESEEQRQQVQKVVQGVPYVTEVRDTFKIIPRPFCEVMELLDPFHARSVQSGFNLSIQPDKQCGAIYRNEELLVIDVVAQKPLQYIYVDYYAADRTMMAHVLPNPYQPDNFLKEDRSITVGGDPNSANRWTIQKPFGLEMVTVIASPRPLFEQPRLTPKGAEKVAPYVEALRRALPNDPANVEIAANYCFITSVDQ